MVGSCKKVEQGVEGDEVMRVLFGEEFGGLAEDGFEGSKEEHQIFKDIFYGTSAEDASSSRGVSGTSNFQSDEGTLAKESVNLNCGGSILASFSSMRDSLGQASEHAKMNFKKTSAFEYFQENSSSWGGSCAHSVNVMRAKSSSTKHLDREKKEPENSCTDTSSDLVHLSPSKVVSNVFMEDSLHEPIACRIVETLSGGILSSYYMFNSEGEMDASGDIDDGVVLNYKCRVQYIGDVKIVVEGKSVTSPVSQESFASGLLATKAPLAPTETPSSPICMKQSAEESMNLDIVDAVSKRPSIKELSTRLESYAHRLLVDAGWKIEPRIRNDRTKPAYYFIKPEEGLVFKALSLTWKACGERLLATALDSEQDENGREWADVDRFWRDLTDTLAYIDKEAHPMESSLSLLRQWQLLDPFMAVVWINKKVGALRAGKALKVVKSATIILSESKNLPDKGVNRVDSNVVELSSCFGSFNQSIQPAPQNFEMSGSSCNQQELAIQSCHDLQSKNRCARVDRKSCCCGVLRKRSLKSLARRIGKGLHNVKCLHDMGSKGLAIQRKRPNRSSSKSAFMQKNSHFSYSAPNGKLLVGNEPCEGTIIDQQMPGDYPKEKTFCEERDKLCKEEGLVHENAPDNSLRVVSVVDRRDTSVSQGSSSREALHRQDLLAREDTPDAVRRVNMQSEMQSSTYQASLCPGGFVFGIDSNMLCNMDLPVYQEFSPVPQEDSIIAEKMVGSEASKSKLKRTSATKAINGSNKKVRKKSKKISEIEATEVSNKGMKTKLHDDPCREVFALSMHDRTDDQLDLPSHLVETNSLRLGPRLECLEQSELFEKQMGSIHHALRIDEVQSATIEIHKNPVKSESKAARQCGKKKGAVSMALEDEAGCTLLKEDLAHHKSTEYKCNAKRLSSDKSTSMTSKKQKVASKSKKARNQLIDPEVSVVAADNGNIPKKSPSEHISDEVLVPASGLSPDPRSSQKVIKANKSEVNKEKGRKRPHGCHINDDDLLIAAIIKNKDFGSCHKKYPSKVGASQPKALRKLKSQQGSYRLLPRALGKGGKHSMDGKRFILGARTVLSWLIEMGAVSLKDVVQYRNPKNNAVVKDGWVTREGILCKCCTQVLSVSNFKAHAGFKQQRPSLNLFLQSGKPYTLCQLHAWSAEYKARKGHMRVMDVEEVDQNDDTCGLCGDGGELICCDNCPSTYHQACLSAKELPEGSWYCPNCICETCGGFVNGKEASSSLAVFECLQCEHKYHDTCIKGKVTCNGEVGSSTWFCGENCQEVYLGLRSRVGVVNCIDDGFSWSVLKCSHDYQKVCSAQKIALMAECNTKLAIALTLMEECFLPMVDPRTGIDMIPHVLYNWGSNFARLNYQGFYAVVLEKGDELISVASIRVHGVTVAEMPLIATCSGRRRQGMCRRLLNAIEKMLISFKVKMLVLSAIPSLVETWTSGFGFKPIEDEEKRELTNVNLMLFPGTTLLKKNLHEASAEESGGNFDSCSIEDQSQICRGLVERANTDTGQQSAENPRSDLDAESLLPIGTNITVEQVDSQQRDLLMTSCENSVLTASRSEHGDVSNAESFSVRMGTSNNYEMDRFFSTEQAVAAQVLVANLSTVVHSCSGSFTPTATNEKLPTHPSSDKTHDAIIRDMEENTSLNVNIPTGDSSVDAMNNERRISFEGDEVEQKILVDDSEGKDGICLSVGQAEEGPRLAAINKELPTDPSSNKIHDVTIRDMEESTSQNVNILTEDSAAHAMNNERRMSFEGDEVEQKSLIDVSEGKDGVCFSDGQAEESPCLAAPNLNEMNLGGINNSEVSADDSSSTSKDEICGFVGRHPVAKGCTTGSVEA